MPKFHQTSHFHPALTLFLHSHWELGGYRGNQGLGIFQPESWTCPWVENWSGRGGRSRSCRTGGGRVWAAVSCNRAEGASDPRIPESQGGLGWKGSLDITNPYLEQGTQGSIQVGLEFLQRGRFHTLPGKMFQSSATSMENSSGWGGICCFLIFGHHSLNLGLGI